MAALFREKTANYVVNEHVRNLLLTFEEGYRAGPMIDDFLLSTLSKQRLKLILKTTR